MFNIFKSKNESERVTNKHIGETKKMGIMEDDYTKAERKERDLASLRGRSPADTFIDASGNKVSVNQLNGQTEQLLRAARSAIQIEQQKNANLKKEGDINENFPPAGKLNKKVFETIERKDFGGEEPRDNLKTDSPAKRSLDVRKERKFHEKANWAPVDREQDFFDSADLVSGDLRKQ